MSSPSSPPANILVVDDTLDNLKVLTAMLARQGYKVRSALNGPTALKSARAVAPDLVLLDINMPEMDGYQVCQELKQDERTRDIPVLFISALDATDDKVRAFQVGGVDYITKPFQFEEVAARVETHLMLYRQRQEIQALRAKERQHFEELDAMKDRMILMVSHDLKNPLSAVLGYTELLQMDIDSMDTMQMQFSLKNIQLGARRMYTLIDDLLDLGKIEHGLALNVAPLVLLHFIQECLDQIRILAMQKRIDLTCSAPADLSVEADHDRLHQVINNLLSNALKYTPEGGRIEVMAERVEDEIIIRVKDSGPGIPAKHLPHLFDKFYRVDDFDHQAVEGTGLGLAIARAIVEQHRGRIWAESTPGAGSTFSIALPRRASS